MTYQSQLLNASFRDAIFYVKSERQDQGGRRIILHPYPNSDTQYVEDLGKLPKTFSLTAFTAGPDWLSQAKTLETELGKEGDGLLTLPHYGSFKAYPLPYDSNASQNEIGRINFNLSFAVGTKQIAPQVAQNRPEDIYQYGDNTRQVLSSDFNANWIVPKKKEAVVTAKEDIANQLKAVNFTTTSVLKDAKKITDIIKILTRSVAVAISDPLVFAQLLFTEFASTDGLYQALSLEANKTRDAVISFVNLSNFNRQVSLWPATTKERIDRNINKSLFYETVSTAALVTAYEQAANIDYNTVRSVQQIRHDIEATAQNQTISNNAVKQSFLDLRLATLDVLAQKEQQAYKVINISKQNGLSSFLQTYELYADELLDEDALREKSTNLRNLNPLLSSSFLTGDVEIFQTL